MSPKVTADYLTTLGWYFVFGILHEFFHFASALCLSLIDFNNDIPRYYTSFLSDILLHRKISFPSSSHYNEEFFDWRLFAVRHIGWLSSLALAVYLHVKEYRNSLSIPASSRKVWCIIAAYLIAMDAIITDLLGIEKLALFTTFISWDTHNLGVNDDTITLYCGNFGVLLLHEAWLDNSGKSALDIIEKMVQVTMMRGAQSGGVVTFDEKKNGKEIELVGKRSRTVKSKREDLSKILRAKIEKDTPFSCLKPKSDNIKFYAGHTRFATTSKATFDGTHPHQWTKPRYYHAFNMEELLDNTGNNNTLRHNNEVVSRRTRIENFITHNGDFEFWSLNNQLYDTEVVQTWLEVATGAKMPAVVDSAAIAGMVDIIRCKGCFGLCARYALCLGLPTSKIMEDKRKLKYPSHSQYEMIGKLFETALIEYLQDSPCPLDVLDSDPEKRRSLARKATAILEKGDTSSLSQYVGDEEAGSGLYEFSTVVINAFFDNDLFNTVKIFLKKAKGSFGLGVMSSLDSHRQVCLAARGQTISLAFYPEKHTVLWGSEQAAMKANMDIDFPGKTDRCQLHRTILNVENDVLRLDLDDLNGEVCLIDWGVNRCNTPAVSMPNRTVKSQSVMNGKVNIYLSLEGEIATQPDKLYHRMTKLTKNELITDLQVDTDDPVLQDIQDIPKICQSIQDDWNNVTSDITSSTFSLNRLTAWNLGRCLKDKLDRYVSGSLKESSNRVDILVTGCEVSLWLAEQFASDLQKAFPKLRITPISSNKLLGLYGQEDISVPTIGHPLSETALDLDNAITIIVSHSGGTFSPLNCSSLFQSKTDNMFVVASEWDTQIGKQLRSSASYDSGLKLAFNSKIFTTGVGMRTAEPCSISVVATHQLLTNILQYISVIVLSNDSYRKITGAVITETDLKILERCNRDNIIALEDIVGVNRRGDIVPSRKESTEKNLRAQGDIWSDHILEGVKAYIMSFFYVMITVTSGYPILRLISVEAGLSSDSGLKYLFGFLDALIYFFLPQINCIILRLIQRRPLLHRMVTRTVVIGDIPWVCQSAEAFLSKIFACSYSIAGVNVFSANPSDHFVHRMTHRVVRGTLLICGRPDGRLSALTAMESAVSLSVNQASSIQSLGSTCESVTIGHNPYKLPLSTGALFLKRFRPLFLCEHLLGEDEDFRMKLVDESIPTGGEAEAYPTGDSNVPSKDSKKGVSSAALLGKFKTLENNNNSNRTLGDDHFGVLQRIIEEAILNKKWSDEVRQTFETLDVNNNAVLDVSDFVDGMSKLDSTRGKECLVKLFNEFDKDRKGVINFDQFYTLMSMCPLTIRKIVQPSIRDSDGLIQVQPSAEKIFGEHLIEKQDMNHEEIVVAIGATKSQNFAQELYESRVASMQRFVSMTVIFHQMGWRVQDFFSFFTFGLVGYRMDRTHSIVRIATTASPISGADVRDRKQAIFVTRKVKKCVGVISNAWTSYKAKMP